MTTTDTPSVCGSRADDVTTLWRLFLALPGRKGGVTMRIFADGSGRVANAHDEFMHEWNSIAEGCATLRAAGAIEPSPPPPDSVAVCIAEREAVTTCDEDGCCSCGSDIIVCADRGSAERLIDALTEHDDRKADVELLSAIHETVNGGEGDPSDLPALIARTFAEWQRLATKGKPTLLSLLRDFDHMLSTRQSLADEQKDMVATLVYDEATRLLYPLLMLMQRWDEVSRG